MLASEFRYSDPIVDDKSLVVVISQSGETLDTMAALREAKKRGGYILSIVNVVGSSIARESDDVLYTWAGPEIAVATTKAYPRSSPCSLDRPCVGEALGTVKKEEYDEAVAELQKLPEKMEQFLASESCEAIPKYASQYFNHSSVFFIGRNFDYALGLEGSLKLKEISYIHSEAYASGELKHGTISLIEDGTLGGPFSHVREWPPLNPQENARGGPPRPPTLAVCSLKSCTRCAMWVRCTWLRHESSAIRYRLQPRLTIVRRE